MYLTATYLESKVSTQSKTSLKQKSSKDKHKLTRFMRTATILIKQAAKLKTPKPKTKPKTKYASKKK